MVVDQGDVLQPGCLLQGHYKVGGLLGRGGFGATYLAWNMNLQVRIAIKEFLPRQLAARASGGTQINPYTGGEDTFNIGLQQFLGEARNLAQFRDHPGIISVLDFFPENGTGYMVMEYLDGSTLEQYLATAGRLDVSVALQLLIPVADALRACHAVGLIHRDISPDNIFLTGDGRVKVLDFGAARFAVGSRSMNLSVILKEGYAPFEQYQRNGRQGPWTDVYALTATLYRLLTGDLPPTAPDRLGGTPLPPPSEKGVKTPPRLQALLDKGLAIQPEQRHQTIDAYLSDLQAVLETLRTSREPTRRLTTTRDDRTGGRDHGRAARPNLFLMTVVGITAATAAAKSTLKIISAGKSPGSIKEGSILWTMPDQMRVARRERVEVRIGDAEIAEDQLRATSLKGRGLPQIDKLDVSPLIRVTLIADENDFAIKSLSSLDQYIRSAEVARWDFDVLPLRSGQRVLRILVSMRLIIEGKDELVDLPSYEREVRVRVAPIHTAGQFCGKNWQWIAGSIAIPIVVWIATHSDIGSFIVRWLGIRL